MSKEPPPPFSALQRRSLNRNSSYTGVEDVIPPPSYEEQQLEPLPSSSRSDPIAVVPRPPLISESRRRSFQAYTVTGLDNGKGKSQAYLKVFGTQGRSVNVPAFMEGEEITGVVELHLEKTEHIETVTIEVEGSSSTLWKNTSVFLSHEAVLWSTTGSDIRVSPKISGEFVWPFAIRLPDRVKINSALNDEITEYALPPTFISGSSSIQLQYKLLVKFRRGRFRVDATISSPFIYCLRSSPSLPSELRQLAYRQEREAPGPKRDPAGWDYVGDMPVKGILFDKRIAEVTCVFYLAKPLSYVRGSSIPFYILLRSIDVQALDLFAARGSLSVLLHRTMTEQIDAKTRETNTKPVGKGACWPSEENLPQTETRRLTGEIPLKEDLQPTFEFENIAITYHISFSLSVPAFTQADGQKALHFQKNVDICSYPSRFLYRPRIPSSEMGQTILEKGPEDAAFKELTGMFHQLVYS
ncbi:hypothetical protein M422DRAFT_240812 [Sphaerobolus stellatus SS14]|nr:hypothetical protein M422DRAFT_240812 [Sphaerobolus stellatus SS14]